MVDTNVTKHSNSNDNKKQTFEFERFAAAADVVVVVEDSIFKVS